MWTSLNNSKPSIGSRRHTLFNIDCSASCPFFEDRVFISSSRLCLSILADVNRANSMFMRHGHISQIKNFNNGKWKIKIWDLKERSLLHYLMTKTKIAAPFYSQHPSCAYLLCTKRIKCWGGTKARSMSTKATTIFFASFLNPSKASVAIAIT